MWLNNGNVFSTILEAGSPRCRSQPIHFLLKPVFLTCRQPPPCCVLSWPFLCEWEGKKDGKREKERERDFWCLFFSYKGQSYHFRVPPAGPHLTWITSLVQSLSHIQLFLTPLTATHQASLSFTISQSLLKLMSIESVMPSNHLILCHPLLLLPSIFPSIRVFFNESVLPFSWPKYWSFSFSISPSNECSVDFL